MKLFAAVHGLIALALACLMLLESRYINSRPQAIATCVIVAVSVADFAWAAWIVWR